MLVWGSGGQLETSSEGQTTVEDNEADGREVTLWKDDSLSFDWNGKGVDRCGISSTNQYFNVSVKTHNFSMKSTNRIKWKTAENRLTCKLWGVRKNTTCNLIQPPKHLITAWSRTGQVWRHICLFNADMICLLNTSIFIMSSVCSCVVGSETDFYSEVKMKTSPSAGSAIFTVLACLHIWDVLDLRPVMFNL